MDEETVSSGSTVSNSRSGTDQSLSQTLSGSISGSESASYVESFERTHVIQDLQLGLTDWTIKARVTNKSRIIPPNKEQNRIATFFNVDLSDGSAKIRVTVCHVTDLHHNFFELHNFFEIDSVYWFSNLEVERYRSPPIDNEYGLLFRKVSKVQEVSNADAEEIPGISYDFVPIESIQSRNDGDFVDVIGICVETGEVVDIVEKTIPEITRNIVLSDGLGKHVTIHLRGPVGAKNFDGSDNPIVTIKGGYICRFQDHVKNTIDNRIITDFYRINPDIPETKILKERIASR